VFPIEKTSSSPPVRYEVASGEDLGLPSGRQSSNRKKLSDIALAKRVGSLLLEDRASAASGGGQKEGGKKKLLCGGQLFARTPKESFSGIRIRQESEEGRSVKRGKRKPGQGRKGATN